MTNMSSLASYLEMRKVSQAKQGANRSRYRMLRHGMDAAAVESRIAARRQKAARMQSRAN